MTFDALHVTTPGDTFEEDTKPSAPISILERNKVEIATSFKRRNFSKTSKPAEINEIRLNKPRNSSAKAGSVHDKGWFKENELFDDDEKQSGFFDIIYVTFGLLLFMLLFKLNMTNSRFNANWTLRTANLSDLKKA